MTTWPNWVDLIIVIILLRTCYNGYGRGVLAETFNLLGAVSATVVTINYWDLVAGWLRPWLWIEPTLANFLVFSGFFLMLIFLVHVILRRITELVKWERLHWVTQGLGLILGGLRGLWWSGVLLLILTASNVTYFQNSVEERSVLGPHLVELSRENLQRVVERFPGAPLKGREVFIPPMKLPASGKTRS